MNIKYIVFFEYEDIVYKGIIHISYAKCASLGDVSLEIDRLKSIYEITWLRVFPVYSVLTKYSMGRL